MMMSLKFLRPAATRMPACLIPLCLLGACTVGPDYQRPELSATAGYAPVANAAQAAPPVVPGEGPALRWWEAFGSAELNALVDRAIAGNRSLAASDATLEQARERRRCRAQAAEGRRQCARPA